MTLSRFHGSGQIPSSRSGLGTAGALFGLALALRLLFLWATPDAGWAHSAWYKGDAATWLDWSRALMASRPFEVGLPIRPPGAAYLIAALWNGTADGIAVLKVVWGCIGALTVVPLYLAARQAAGARIGLAVGLICAGSTGLLVLSTSLNNEAPYLFLVALSIVLNEPLRRCPRVGGLILWSAANALACLLRAEHLLYFVMVLAFLLASWTRTASGIGGGEKPGLSVLRRVALAVAVFVAVLAPWHLTAWAQIRRFNAEPARVDQATENAQRNLERLLAGIQWSDEAVAELQRVPAAVRRTTGLFITATEGVRGRSVVTPASFDVLDQAFGTRPRPLRRYPYLALYGGLNFYLANHADSNGGFSRAPLERPPRLQGGLNRYPLALVSGLPPPQLTLSYPPHLEAVNDGYRLGLTWIRDHPVAYLQLAGRKLGVFWSGATLGLGGYNFPLGLSGLRRQVDLVVPVRSPLTDVWRAAILVLMLTGLWAGRMNAALVPWTLLLATKLIVTLAFFGYARQGATIIPVVALLGCIAGAGIAQHLGRWWIKREEKSVQRLFQLRGRLGGRAALLAGFLLLGAETTRFLAKPEVRLDQRRIGARAPFPEHDHRDRQVLIK